MKINTQTWLCGNPPKTGQRQRYPGRFLYNLKKYYLGEGMDVLSMFSGASDIGVTTDIRPETGADIIAPFTRIPLPDSYFDMVIADPPYNTGYGLEWVKQKNDVPKPKHVSYHQD